ncbi:MAG: hypothetical protein A3G87_09275 [Omnitrophica bacterium RIFCSPLOWO2_12_FULL_50_11]|nr:MAG: hypothetical protein A3G87_09275 [Omnitrophica bacterium RIFCSPLOWO2_12_FULL_50_11]
MRKKILIIDDDPDVSDLLTARLETFGYEIVSAQNGADGCTKVREVNPELIFLDVTFPGESGVEILKKLKSEMPTGVQKIPVIMLTSSEHLEKDCAAAGAAGYITKPFDLYQLKEILSKHVPAH